MRVSLHYSAELLGHDSLRAARSSPTRHRVEIGTKRIENPWMELLYFFYEPLCKFREWTAQTSRLMKANTIPYPMRSKT